MTAPLTGLRVFDLTRILAGPTCTQLLGDLGAEVIKIERPGQGDDTRKWGPPFVPDANGEDTTESAYYLSANRNKRSVSIDISRPEGQKLAGMAHHKVHDVKWTQLSTGPHEDPMPRFLQPPSTAATLNLAANAAQAARIWKGIDKPFADKCLAAAERAWAAAKANPEIIAPPAGDGGGPYDDKKLEDDFYWAAAELYVTTGKPEKCRLSVGLKYASGKVDKHLHFLYVVDTRFAIPPGAPAHPVKSSRTLPCEAEGVGLFSHMHTRGRDMTFTAHYPDGKSETLLLIPNFNFDWQMPYIYAPGKRIFPKGTRIECVAHYDNSGFNPFNPDPKATVREGQQTFHEMMNGFFFYVDRGEKLGLDIDGKTGRVKEEPK